jgi:hypothetical protein
MLVTPKAQTKVKAKFLTMFIAYPHSQVQEGSLPDPDLQERQVQPCISL